MNLNNHCTSRQKRDRQGQSWPRSGLEKAGLFWSGLPVSLLQTYSVLGNVHASSSVRVYRAQTQGAVWDVPV
eukprot:229099-Chlamydomonas_euryale.AAC.9